MIEQTKGRVLQHLRAGKFREYILPVYIVKSSEFFSNRAEVLREVISFADGNCLIVRSSSREEDTSEYSNAGGYDSVLHVLPTETAISCAIERVYASYHKKSEEEILIQPMLQGIVKSGVVLTADMDTFSDYDIVNYFEGDDSTAVTGGEGRKLKTFIHYKGRKNIVPDVDMARLLQVCDELEEETQNPALDIEFAFTKDGHMYILQVRPIAHGNKNVLPKKDLSGALNRIHHKVEKLSRKHPFLLGNTTYFGVMPDWNPAEILGVRPRKLAISLYKELVTDQVWANQRDHYGYRDLTMHPLMVSFCGIPYIDTRITFNSFVPKKLNEKIAEKLVNYYLERLREYPKYHDKIEFEIVFSCYYFGISDKLKKLLNYGFNENEIKRIEYALLDITNDIIDVNTGLYKKDIEQIDILEKNYNQILESNISLVDRIYWLIEECKKYGTLPFAGVARAGFIAVQFLKSFVECGIISNIEYDGFLNSISTVNKNLSRDLKKYFLGELSKEHFLNKYGHVRPGTYDILSKRYDENFDEYFQQYAVSNVKETEFDFSEEIIEKIQTELDQHGILITAENMICFIREAIEGREYLKFVFTKAVSKILSLIEELGVRTGISREDMSYLDISVVKQLYSDLYSGNVGDIFRENIEDNKIQYAYAQQIKLPAIILNPDNIYNYYLLEEEPNFITQKSVYGETVELEGSRISELKGKIVFIQSADPGYDYLFSKGIGGLVTQFGGVNSHMAIRCAELGIPAVIGAGEQNYTGWKKSRALMLDCSKHQVIVM